MLLMGPSALKRWIVAGISLGKTDGSPGIVIGLSRPRNSRLTRKMISLVHINLRPKSQEAVPRMV